jgi:hypothetical protein
MFIHSLVLKLKGSPQVGEIAVINGCQFRFLGEKYNRRYRERIALYRCRTCCRDIEAADLRHHAKFERESRAYNAERSRLLREAYSITEDRGNSV